VVEVSLVSRSQLHLFPNHSHSVARWSNIRIGDVETPLTAQVLAGYTGGIKQERRALSILPDFAQN